MSDSMSAALSAEDINVLLCGHNSIAAAMAAAVVTDLDDDLDDVSYLEEFINPTFLPVLYDLAGELDRNGTIKAQGKPQSPILSPTKMNSIRSGGLPRGSCARKQLGRSQS